MEVIRAVVVVDFKAFTETTVRAALETKDAALGTIRPAVADVSVLSPHFEYF